MKLLNQSLWHRCGVAAALAAAVAGVIYLAAGRKPSAGERIDPHAGHDRSGGATAPQTVVSVNAAGAQSQQTNTVSVTI